MTTDFRALCSELVEQVQRAINNHGLCLEASDALMHRARAALAKPADAPAAVAERPSDEELRDLWSWAAGQDQGPWPTQYHCFARAVLARWGRPAAAPVRVSERLPGPEDCDAEGRCWWGEPQIGDSHDATWSLCSQDDAEEFLTWRTKCGWLPANALPLPAPEGGEVNK